MFIFPLSCDEASSEMSGVCLTVSCEFWLLAWCSVVMLILFCYIHKNFLFCRNLPPSYTFVLFCFVFHNLPFSFWFPFSFCSAEIIIIIHPALLLTVFCLGTQTGPLGLACEYFLTNCMSWRWNWWFGLILFSFWFSDCLSLSWILIFKKKNL